MWRKIRLGLILALACAAGIAGVTRLPLSSAVSETERDGALAVMLLSLLFAMLALITGIGWMLFRRRFPEPSPGMPDETRRGGTGPQAPPSRTTPPSGPGSAPWEKPADWWKKQDL